MEDRILKTVLRASVILLKCFFICILLLSCTPKAEKNPLPISEPLRIVSLSPAITEILFAIGAGDRVVGVTQYCDFPPEAQTRTKVGGFSGATVSVEQIRYLNPDLVILSGDMHARIVSLLNELNIPSLVVEPRNFSQVYSTIARMGEITGYASGAEKVIAEMKEKIVLVEKRVNGREKPSVFWILNDEPIMSAGSDTFISEAIKLGGGKNIFDDLSGQWPMVSMEQVLLRKPDWFFFGSDLNPAVITSSRWQIIPALREGRFVIMEADKLYRYGPRLADAVKIISDILHP